MNQIIKLPQHTIQKIAAGEVVERPVNVIKELVENSIDAESTKITIEIENGGLDRIKVTDNGTGIASDQLNFAFQLHTTSKIQNSNITEVATLGFRGEALAAISGVSRVTCTSKTIEANDASTIIIEGASIIKESIGGRRQGTSIEVSGLFFNIPARRKFLKKPTTERKRISELIIGFSLNFPQLHFVLQEKAKSGGIKIRVESPSRKSVKAAIYDVLGKDIAENLIEFSSKLGNWSVSGFTSKPILTRSDRSVQYLFVNHRMVRNQELQSAIESGYGSQLLRSNYPVFVISLTGDLDEIDYNVHPQKVEIRFKPNEEIFGDLSSYISKTLRKYAKIPMLKNSAVPPELVTEMEIDGAPMVDTSVPLDQLFSVEISQGSSLFSPNNVEAQDMKSRAAVTGKRELNQISRSKIIGHLMNKFAIIEDNNQELWIMDVHAADERIKFEKFEQGIQRKTLVQTLLEPIEIKFSDLEKQLILDQTDVLVKFGLKISASYDGSLLLHSLPVYFDQEITDLSIGSFLKDILAYLHDMSEFENLDFSTPFTKIEYGIVARLACHGAIRSGYPVSNQRIARVLQELFQCSNPWTCAHGRPTILRIPKSRLDGWFKR
ncbi:MAG: DNA mismatch repair endonuclease MutL [Candidatus Heimdallarchaeota archaeon]|nr:DNA mismatch repair endonuclease MutL [Candidatus Heimdallarchaeota archaeon]